MTSCHVTHSSLSESVSERSTQCFQMGIADITHYVTPCYVKHMSCNVTSRHVTLASLSEYVSERSIHCFQMGLFKFPLLTIADMSHYVTPCHVTHMSWHDTSCHITSQHVTLRHITSRHTC